MWEGKGVEGWRGRERGDEKREWERGREMREWERWREWKVLRS